MKKYNAVLLVLLLLTVPAGAFDITVHAGYCAPLFSSAGILKGGYSLSASVPIQEGERTGTVLEFFQDTMTVKNFPEISFKMIGITASFRYYFMRGFSFDLYGEAGLSALSEELKRDEMVNGYFFFAIPLSVQIEYFYTEKVHLIARSRTVITDSVYYTCLCAGIKVML